MTDRDYDRLLDTIQSAMQGAITRVRKDKPRAKASAVPIAANDNSEPWPLTPFPTGWNASS